MRRMIATSKAPQALGSYSQGLVVNHVLYLSAQLPLVPSTMALCSPDIAQQAPQVFANLAAVCRAADASLEELIELTIYLIDVSDITWVNQVIADVCPPPFPARSTIGVASLPKGAKIAVSGMVLLNNA